MMAVCESEQQLKYTPRALHYQLDEVRLMFNSMFAPPASVEFASKLIANFTRVTHLVVKIVYAACRNTPKLRAGF
jgi:hypothetical protein